MELNKEYKVMVFYHKRYPNNTNGVIGESHLGWSVAVKRMTEESPIVEIDKEVYPIIEENKDFSQYNNPYVAEDIWSINHNIVKYLFESNDNVILKRNGAYSALSRVPNEDYYQLYNLPFSIYKDYK